MLLCCRSARGEPVGRDARDRSTATVAATRGGERGSRRGNARGIATTDRVALPRSQVRLLGPADDQPRRRHAGAAGVAQGARAARLSGARPARGAAQPAVRTAVGRPERSARRAALVPEQDPGHRRRARPAQGRYRGGHGPARPGGLLRRCARGRARDPGRASRRLAPERLRTLSGLFAGDFLEGLEIDRSPAFNGWLTAQRRRFRGCHAALLEQLVASVPTTRRSAIWRNGWSWRRSTGASTSCCSTRSRGAAGSARARSIWRRPPACSKPRASITRRCATPGARPGRQTQTLRRGHRRGSPRRRIAAAAVTTAVSGRAAPRLHRGDAVRRPVRATHGVRGGAADALAHDVITRLAKLRSLFVIAQGTVFALHERQHRRRRRPAGC